MIDSVAEPEEVWTDADSVSSEDAVSACDETALLVQTSAVDSLDSIVSDTVADSIEDDDVQPYSVLDPKARDVDSAAVVAVGPPGIVLPSVDPS